MATFIAHGDVALSVLMTTASTLGAIIMTPTLTRVLAGTLVPVDAWVSTCLTPPDRADPGMSLTAWQHRQSLQMLAQHLLQLGLCVDALLCFASMQVLMLISS